LNRGELGAVGFFPQDGGNFFRGDPFARALEFFREFGSETPKQSLNAGEHAIGRGTIGKEVLDESGEDLIAEVPTLPQRVFFGIPLVHSHADLCGIEPMMGAGTVDVALHVAQEGTVHLLGHHDRSSVGIGGTCGVFAARRF
jgi:hypothetical protein